MDESSGCIDARERTWGIFVAHAQIAFGDGEQEMRHDETSNNMSLPPFILPPGEGSWQSPVIMGAAK